MFNLDVIWLGYILLKEDMSPSSPVLIYVHYSGYNFLYTYPNAENEPILENIFPWLSNKTKITLFGRVIWEKCSVEVKAAAWS